MEIRSYNLLPFILSPQRQIPNLQLRTFIDSKLGPGFKMRIEKDLKKKIETVHLSIYTKRTNRNMKGTLIDETGWQGKSTFLSSILISPF